MCYFFLVESTPPGSLTPLPYPVCPPEGSCLSLLASFPTLCLFLLQSPSLPWPLSSSSFPSSWRPPGSIHSNRITPQQTVGWLRLSASPLPQRIWTLEVTYFISDLPGSGHRIATYVAHSRRQPPHAHACPFCVCRLHPHPWPAGLSERGWGRCAGGLRPR